MIPQSGQFFATNGGKHKKCVTPDVHFSKNGRVVSMPSPTPAKWRVRRQRTVSANFSGLIRIKLLGGYCTLVDGQHMDFNHLCTMIPFMVVVMVGPELFEVIWICMDFTQRNLINILTLNYTHFLPNKK